MFEQNRTEQWLGKYIDSLPVRNLCINIFISVTNKVHVNISDHLFFVSVNYRIHEQKV